MFIVSRSAGEYAPGELDLGPVLDMRGELPLDPIGVRLAHSLRPSAVSGRLDFLSRVAFHEARRLGHLQPKNRRPRRRAARIELGRLADTNRWLRRKQAAFGLVRSARNAVQSACEVYESDLGEIRIAAPAGRAFERIMDLHVALSVPKGFQAGSDVGRGRQGAVLAEVIGKLFGRSR